MMKHNGFNLAAVLLALLLTLGVLLGGLKFYNTNFIEKPLYEQLIALNYVEAATISKVEDVYQIEIQIRQADDLKNEYQAINQIIVAQIKGRKYNVVLADKQDQFLHSQLQQMELAVYEAIAHNNYLDLYQRFADSATRNHFAYRLQVDQHRLYVQMSHGDNFLLEIIELDDTDKTSGKKEG